MKLESNLEKKRELERKIKFSKMSVGNLPNLSSRWSEVADWRLRMENLMAQYGNDMQRIMKARGDDYSHMKKTIERLSSRLKDEEKIADNTKKNLAELEAELASLDLQVSQKELLTLQGKVTEVELALAKLNEAVVMERSKIDDDEHSNNQTLARLTEEKENLLAEIASGGKVDFKQLEQLEKQITDEEARLDNNAKSTITASQAIFGLQRKIAMVEGELSLAKSNFASAAATYLRSEIDQAGKEYIDFVNQCSSSFMRVASLAELCAQLGEPVNVFGPYTARCQMPSFALAVCQMKEQADTSGYLFKYQGSMTADCVRKEIERLQTLGLKLPL